MEELRQKIMETGLLPTEWKNGGGLINVTPQRVENRSGRPRPNLPVAIPARHYLCWIGGRARVSMA